MKLAVVFLASVVLGSPSFVEADKEAALKGLEYLNQKLVFQKQLLRENPFEGLQSVYEQLKDFPKYLSALNADQLGQEVMQAQERLVFEERVYEEIAASVADGSASLELMAELYHQDQLCRVEYVITERVLTEVYRRFARLKVMGGEEDSFCESQWDVIINALGLIPMSSSLDKSSFDSTVILNLGKLSALLFELKLQGHLLNKLKQIKKLADELKLKVELDECSSPQSEAWSKWNLQSRVFMAHGSVLLDELGERVKSKCSRLNTELEFRSGAQLVAYFNDSLFADILTSTSPLDRLCKEPILQQLSTLHPLRAEYLKGVLLAGLTGIQSHFNALPVLGLSRFSIQSAINFAQALHVDEGIKIERILEFP